MEHKNIFQFNIKWDNKTTSLFILLLALPNLLGLLNLSTPWGFKIHFFQLAIFLAAMIYGPVGGMLSGGLGSVYSAAIMHNPYLIVGNMILGFFAGLFVRYGIGVVISVILAYIIQLAWLVPTDYYLMHLPVTVIQGLVIALLISNTIWAVLAKYTIKPIKKSMGLK